MAHCTSQTKSAGMLLQNTDTNLLSGWVRSAMLAVDSQSPQVRCHNACKGSPTGRCVAVSAVNTMQACICTRKDSKQTTSFYAPLQKQSREQCKTGGTPLKSETVMQTNVKNRCQSKSLALAPLLGAFALWCCRPRPCPLCAARCTGPFLWLRQGRLCRHWGMRHKGFCRKRDARGGCMG